MNLFDVENQKSFIDSDGPIRVGCVIEYYRPNEDDIIKGKVIRSTYTDRKKQNHLLIIEKEDGSLFMGLPKVIYPRLISHIPGEESKEIKKLANKLTFGK